MSNFTLHGYDNISLTKSSTLMDTANPLSIHKIESSLDQKKKRKYKRHDSLSMSPP